jgi:DNA topoisomerase-1
MAVVTIYNQGQLEYVVLPNREVLAKYPDDIALSIHKAEQSSFWRDKKRKQFLQAEGTEFFKRHADTLDTSFSMEDSNGKMSAGFFLYLAFRRFQNQKVQAHFINDDEVDNLLKPDDTAKKSDDLAKLLVLETAIEYLVKANPGEKIEYIDSESQLPKNTRLIRTERGAIGYYPSEVGQYDATLTQEDIEGDQLDSTEGVPLDPTGEREIDIVAPDDDDDEVEGQGIIGGKIDAKAFIDKMKLMQLRPLDDLIKTFSRISEDQKKELVRESALAGKGPQTDATPITPNIAVVNDEGKVTKITTADGQLQAVQEFDPANPDRGGKLHLFFSTDSNDKVQVRWLDSRGRQHGGYSVEHTKGQAIKKFNKIKQLHKIIPTIEKQCKADITSNSKNKETALVIALIHNTYRRVGSGKSKVVWDGKEGRPGPKKDEEGKFIRDYVATYGITSLQAQHLEVKGTKLYLNFLGKSGKLNYVEVTDSVVKKELLARRKAAGRNKTAPIMNVKPPAVNAYLKQVAGDEFSVKNFRTYHATRLAANLVANTRIPKINRAKFDAFMKRRVSNGKIKDATQWKEESFLWALKERNKLKLDVIGEPISSQLSNTKQVCVAQYIDPLVFKDWDSYFDEASDTLTRSRPPAAKVLTAAYKAAQKKDKDKAKAKTKAEEKEKEKQ